MVRAGAGSLSTTGTRLHDCRIKEAVYQAIYNTEAGKVQTMALAIHNAHFGYNIEGESDVQGRWVAVRLASCQLGGLAWIAFWRRRRPR